MGDKNPSLDSYTSARVYQPWPPHRISTHAPTDQFWSPLQNPRSRRARGAWRPIDAPRIRA